MAGEMIPYLVDCTNVILNEIALGLPAKSIALTYRLAMQSDVAQMDTPDWPRINRAIIDKWGMPRLTRIKEMAWAADGRRQRG